MSDQEVRERVLAAAGPLFYSRGFTAVGMDDIRDASGVSLKSLYLCFSSKERLVEAVLIRRDDQWMAALAQQVDSYSDPRLRLLAVFGFLADWFASPGFRGCAFINAFGELGSRSPAIAEITRLHKQRLRRYLAQLATDAGAPDPAELAGQLLVLMDGAIVVAATGTSTSAAAYARQAAQALLDATPQPRQDHA
jgi:AcrR family transcriptional regulator